MVTRSYSGVWALLLVPSMCSVLGLNEKEFISNILKAFFGLVTLCKKVIMLISSYKKLLSVLFICGCEQPSVEILHVLKLTVN